MPSDAEDLVAFLHEKNKPEVCTHAYDVNLAGHAVV
jgi:hypothetical protein